MSRVTSYFCGVRHALAMAGRIIWQHPGKFLALFVTSMTVATIGHYAVVQLTPASHYLRYSSVTIDNVIRGERAEATICYTVNERYVAQGDVAFYLENEKRQRVYNSKVKFDFTLSGETPCERESIPTEDLEPGKYYIRLYRDIQVSTWIPGVTVPKKVDYAPTNSFMVRKRPVSQAEFEELLREVNDRIDALNRRLDEERDAAIEAPVSKRSSTARAQQPTTSGSGEAPQITGSDVSTTAPSRPEAPSPPTEPQRPLLERILDPVRNVIRNREG